MLNAIPTELIYLYLTVTGLIGGSFVSALTWRLRQGKDFVKDRSRCVHCNHVLSAKELIPLFSWAFQKGKCVHCQKTISTMYPIIEATTALLLVISYWQWPDTLSNTTGIIGFITWLFIVVGFVALAVYDLRWQELPTSIIKSLTVVQLSNILVQYFFYKNLDYVSEYLIAAICSFAFFYFIYILGNGKWMGGGDVRLAFLLGLVSGVNVIPAFYIAFITGALLGVGLIITKQLSKGQPMPFGPFLLAGTYFAVLYGDYLREWYLATFL